MCVRDSKGSDGEDDIAIVGGAGLGLERRHVIGSSESSFVEIGSGLEV